MRVQKRMVKIDHCEVKYKASIWMQFSRRIETISGATLALLIQLKDYLALPFDFQIRIIQTVLQNCAGIQKPSAFCFHEEGNCQKLSADKISSNFFQIFLSEKADGNRISCNCEKRLFFFVIELGS